MRHAENALTPLTHAAVHEVEFHAALIALRSERGLFEDRNDRHPW